MGLSVNELKPPLDDIAYLSRSNHRVDVLTELIDTGCTRRELRESVGVSQPTIGRILDGFQERGWIRQNGRHYTITSIGKIVGEAFNELMSTVDSVQALSELQSRLPLEEFGFDLRLLEDARITMPSPSDSSAHIRREEVLAEQAEEIRFFCNSAHLPTVRVYRDRVVEDGQSLEAIIAGEALEVASNHPAMAEALRDLLEADQSSIYRYDGVVPVMVGLLDETAVIAPLDEFGMACALIESEHAGIREWVVETIDSYRAEAEEIATGMVDI